MKPYLSAFLPDGMAKNFPTQGKYGLIQLVALLLVPFVIVIVMVLLGYLSSERLATRMANNEMERTIDHTVSSLGELLLPVRSLVRVAGSLGSLTPEYFDGADAHVLLDQMLAHSPMIDSVYVGLPNGSFRMSMSLAQSPWRTHFQFPEQTELVHRWLVQSERGGPARDTFDLLDHQQQLIDRVVRDNPYDPRLRPWYQQAASAGSLQISEPYAFATKHVAGITVAMPFYGPKHKTLAGVVAADILVSQISELLRQHPVSPGAVTVLLNAQNQIIAFPEGRESMWRSARMQEAKLHLSTFESILPDEVLASFSAADMLGEPSGRFGDYLLKMVSLEPVLGKSWKLAVLVPLSDFYEPLNERNQELLLLGMLAILLEALIAFMVLNRIRALYERQQRAQQEALLAQELVVQNLRESEQHLEQRVRERTYALEEANRRLETLSTTDVLTSIWNRRKFEEVLQQEWNRGRRSGQALSLLLIDVDWFKAYNDHYGHLAGDDCLRQVAAVLKEEACRAGDFYARIGGEEFAVLSCGNPDSARQLAESIRVALANQAMPHHASRYQVVTVSVGVASMIPGPDFTTDLLYKRADQALYGAKDQGRNCVAVSGSGLGGEAELA